MPHILCKNVITIEHHPPLLTHLDHLGGLVTEILVELTVHSHVRLLLGDAGGCQVGELE